MLSFSLAPPMLTKVFRLVISMQKITAGRLIAIEGGLC
jgi:hypothetical protein